MSFRERWSGACGVRPRVLLLAICGLAPAFLVTNQLVTWHHQQYRRLSHEWAERGKRAVWEHRFGEAVDDLRTALLYDGNDREHRLQLAEVLMTLHQPVRARGELSVLWQGMPNDGRTNLDMARIAVAENDYVSAVRYYRAAVAAPWPHNSGGRTAASAELHDLVTLHPDTVRPR
jgi:hypothetical protein